MNHICSCISTLKINILSKPFNLNLPTKISDDNNKQFHLCMFIPKELQLRKIFINYYCKNLHKLLSQESS